MRVSRSEFNALKKRVKRLEESIKKKLVGRPKPYVPLIFKSKQYRDSSGNVIYDSQLDKLKEVH